MRTQRQPVRTLDKLDHKILRLLQQDGRMAMKDLAEQVGLSVTPRFSYPSYRKLLGDILLQLPGAVQSKSYVVMEEIKETLTIPVGDETTR